jgi:hypothetical protein
MTCTTLPLPSHLATIRFTILHHSSGDLQPETHWDPPVPHLRRDPECYRLPGLPVADRLLDPGTPLGRQQRVLDLPTD